MDVITKDATITNTGNDDAFPGTFRVILSTPTEDRDGEEVRTAEWKTPLPEHITFDTDHGMSVASTVGSGTPYIDTATGNLIVDGTYSTLQHAQDTRTLVKEKHIRTTSVTFRRIRNGQKDGRTVMQRELLNGSFVSVPANPEAIILESKSIAAKAGRRNSNADQEHLDAIARHAIALGATPPSSGGDTNSDEDVAAGKSVSRQTVAKAATLDSVLELLAGTDLEELPADVRQAIELIRAADADGDVTPDSDEDVETAAPTVTAEEAAAAEKAAEAERIDIIQRAARKRFALNLSEGN